MKIKRVWLECEDTDGKCYMAPATPEYIRQIQAQAENSADEVTRRDLEAANRHLEGARATI